MGPLRRALQTSRTICLSPISSNDYCGSHSNSQIHIADDIYCRFHPHSSLETIPAAHISCKQSSLEPLSLIHAAAIRTRGASGPARARRYTTLTPLSSETFVWGHRPANDICLPSTLSKSISPFGRAKRYSVTR